jgi:hypothetical protein
MLLAAIMAVPILVLVTLATQEMARIAEVFTK